ncbi:NAD-dependent epimerase/dehydratase family protein [Hyalangium gracile]|uniref:NAD-dependent epimerase/dehydratase family protein n=1 Tax=Hyalangium gracile TaxID=394092 RepID=UPI001CCD54D9|nr:NAD-dependent epimerase/dehydratase family protein [Hyalangium gracile]
MHVLVTGGAGFIGSHVVDALLNEGHSVVILDDLSMGRTANLPTRAGRLEVLIGSVLTPELCARAARHADAIIHLAARNSVPRSLVEPRLVVDVNVVGTLNVLEAARNAGVSRVVYASSSSVYGAAPRLPMREEQPVAACSPYAATKAAMEQLAQAWTRSFGLPTIGLRFFNVFGPRQRPQSPYAAVIPRFVGACLRGGEAIIYGNGEQTRDFTYVENVVTATLRALIAAEVCFGNVYNIAMGAQISVREVYAAVARATRCERPPRHEPRRAGEIPHSQADASAAARDLGWRGHCAFEQGLAKAVSWYAEREEKWWTTG